MNRATYQAAALGEGVSSMQTPKMFTLQSIIFEIEGTKTQDILPLTDICARSKYHKKLK